MRLYFASKKPVVVTKFFSVSFYTELKKKHFFKCEFYWVFLYFSIIFFTALFFIFILIGLILFSRKLCWTLMLIKSVVFIFFLLSLPIKKNKKKVVYFIAVVSVFLHLLFLIKICFLLSNQSFLFPSCHKNFPSSKWVKNHWFR